MLRLGLADTDELQKYRRALRSSKKAALQSPEMRAKLADLLDKLIDLTTQDPATYSRVRYRVMTKEALALLNKAERSGIDVSILAEVFVRGLQEDNDSGKAFNRVNSFIAGGKAAEMDNDLFETITTKRTQGDKHQIYKDGVRIGSVGHTYSDTHPFVSKRIDPKRGVYVSLKHKTKQAAIDHVVKSHEMREAVKEPTGGLKDACWSGYTAVGMKMKNGRKVPNCVPKEETTNEAFKIKSKEAETSYNTHDDMMKNADRAKLKTVLGGIMKDMQPREQQILRARFWDNKTLAQIAKETGVSPVRIRQIESRALNKLKAPINAKKLTPFREESMDEATKQQKAAGAALATQRGEYAGGKKGGAINRMALMKKKELIKLATKKKETNEAKYNWKKAELHTKHDTQYNRGVVKKSYVDRKLNPYKADDAKIAADMIKDFIAKGGKPTQLPPGKRTIKSYSKPKKYMTPNQAAKVGVTEQATNIVKSFNEMQRDADVKMTKIRNPDGTMSFRKERVPTKVQQETSHPHPTGKVPYASMTNKEMQDDLRKKTKAASEGYTGSEPTSSNPNDPSNRFVGTDAIRKNYASMTPGQEQVAGQIGTAEFSPEKPSYGSPLVRTRTEVDQSKDDASKKHFNEIRKALSGIRESNDLNESFAAGFELAPFARDYGIRVQSSFEHHPEVQEQLDAQEDEVNEAIYQGRNVPLNQPMKGDVKKSKVYVRDPSTGNIKKVNFGDKKLSIKKDQPARKRSYCARSSGQGNLTKKTSANYWSRRAWDC